MIFLQNFDILGSNPIPEPRIRNFFGDCEYTLPAIAEMVTRTNTLFNDYHNFIAFFPNQVASATVRLITATGEVEIGTKGVISSLGYFTNSKQEKPISVRIDWFEVLNQIGAGCYQLVIRGDLGSTTLEYKSFKFNLLPYSEHTADETVRIEWTLSGKVGDPTNQANIRDFDKQQFINCLRLPNALFGGDNSEAEQENVRYQNGKKKYTTQNRKTKYELELGFYPYQVHNYIQYDIMMGENVELTDFNSENPALHTKTKITNFGEYAPEWYVGSEYAKCVVECESEFDNHYKFR
jgi:hypothetical protein